MTDRSNIIIITGLCIIILAAIGFGISVIIIYDKGMKFTDTNVQNTNVSLNYPNLSQIITYTATKDIFALWSWTYDLNIPTNINISTNNVSFTGKIIQKCPTVNHDADLLINDKLIGRTDKKTIDIYQLNNILDGNGNIIYSIKTGSISETLINGNKIVINFGIYDLNNALVGYYTGIDFIIENNIIIKNIDGYDMLKMTKTITPVWEWTVSLLNDTMPFNDFRLSALIIGFASFSDSPDKTDVCNQYFWTVSWTILSVVIILFGCLIAFIIFKLYEYQKTYTFCSRRFENCPEQTPVEKMDSIPV